MEDTPIELLEREDQFRQLRQAFELAIAGRGRIVAIAGEAGAGKTVLTEQFVRLVGASAVVHWGACEHLSTPEALLPLRDIARAAGELLDTTADHVQLFEWLLRLLSDAPRPSILVIEDLHWADTATLDLLRFLARRISRVSTLLLVTYRDDDLGSRSPIRHLLGEAVAGTVERMTLQSLSLDAVRTLSRTAGRLGDDVFALTAGNPFLVTETLAAGGHDPSDAVRDATLARASRLSASALRVLEAAAIFPRHAETALVADLVPVALDPALDECIDAGMLKLEGGVVRYHHELARRAVESSISPALRRDLHRRVVAELQKRPASRASELAHHAERAGDLPALIEYSNQAGAEAAQAGAPREAADHFANMLRHRPLLDRNLLLNALECHAEQSYLMGNSGAALESMQEAAQLRRGALDRVALGRNLTRMTRFAWMCGRRADAERFVGEAIPVLESVSPSAELASAYSHRSQLDMLAWHMASALHWGERALALAKQLGHREIVAHALGNLGAARADLETRSCCPELEESFSLAVANGYHDHVMRALCNLTCICYWRRDYTASLDFIERGVTYAVARELTSWSGYIRGWRSMIRLDQGDWSAAEDEAQEISSRQAISDVYRFPALITLARLRSRRGDPDDGTPLEAARGLSASLAELQRLIYVAVADAERLWLTTNPTAGDVEVPASPASSREAVIARLREVQTLGEARSVRWVIELSALWMYVLGERGCKTDSLSGPYRDHCEGRWREAAAGWEAMGHPYERAIALGEGDDPAQRKALELFDRLGAVPAATRLRREMRAGGSRAIPRGPIGETRSNPVGLTRRQAQVLELVREGLTNGEIADRLCISGKTAEHHVSAIMARFDARTRREAIAAARKWGLFDQKK